MKIKLYISKLIKKYFVISLALALIIWLLTRYFYTNEMPRLEHMLSDYQFHAARLANYYLALKQGQLPPRWAPNLNFGFGYPVLGMIYPYPYLLGSLFYMLGLTIQASLNAVVIISCFLAVIGMFIYLLLELKNKYYALLGSLLYLGAQYSLLNIFVRGAIGEVSFWGLLPWVMIISFYSKKKTLIYYLSAVIIFTLFLLSHQLSLLVAIPVISAWVISQWKKNKLTIKKIIKHHQVFLIATITAVLLSQFFWLPMIFEKKFVQIQNDYAVKNFDQFYPKTSSLLYSDWNYATKNKPMSMMIGFPHLFIVIVSVIIFFKNKKKHQSWFLFWLFSFLVSIFFMLPISEKVWRLSQVLPYLQFPWRFLWLTIFSSVMLFIYIFRSKSFNFLKILTISLILMEMIFRLIFHTRVLFYHQQSDYEWFEYPLSSGAADEHMPIWWSKEKNAGLMEKVVLREKDKNLFSRDENKNLVQNNIGQSEIINWTGSQMEYIVDTPKDSEVIQKTAYFPGWRIYVDDKKADIKFQDPEFPGRIIFTVKAGKHHIISKFTQLTTYRRIGDFLTIGGLITLISYSLVLFKKQRYVKK